MGVMIEPIPDSVRVKVSGDVETVLPLPYEDDERFMVALSDGTLLVGGYDKDFRCNFAVARDGAGIVRLEQGKARIDSDIQWATISVYGANVVECAAPEALPLFPGQDDLDDAVPW